MLKRVARVAAVAAVSLGVGALFILGSSGFVSASVAAQPELNRWGGDVEGGGPGDGDRGKLADRVPERDVAALDEAFGPLALLAGHAYEIDGEWRSGEPILARNEYRADLDGAALLSHVYTEAPDGKVYQRYLTVWTAGPGPAQLTAYGVTYDGSAESLIATHRKSPDGDPIVASSWSVPTPRGEVRMKQEIEIEEAGASYAWRVWSKGPGAEEFTAMMEGRWVRVVRLER